MQTKNSLHYPRITLNRPTWLILSAVLGGFIVGTIFLAWSVFLPANQIAAGVQLQNRSISGKSEAEIATLLESFSPPNVQRIQVSWEDQTWQTDTDVLGIQPDLEETLQRAKEIGRTGSLFFQLKDRWNARWFGKDISPAWKLDSTQEDEWIKSIETDLNRPGKQPSVSLSGSVVKVDPGESDALLDTVQLKNDLHSAIQEPKQNVIQITPQVSSSISPLTADGIMFAEQRAEKLKRAQLQIIAGETDAPLTIPASTFFHWLNWPTGMDLATAEAGLQEKTMSWNREALNAEFEVAPDGKHLSKFVPERKGRKLQLESLVEEVNASLQMVENAPELPPQPMVITAQFIESEPEKSLGDINTLGIRERIAVGTSEYKGSIPNRAFNVAHTAQKMHGLIIPPGEEFSFNGAVGDISAQTGFRSAYVIKDGRTQLGDGGGVCQVSTTIFRAALNGGLPITRWKAHSYRVGYYEQGNQPGFDATVYAPSVDFRWKNDTGNSIAIAAYVDDSNKFLTIELWGTQDGRQSSISDYKIWNQRAAPAPLYVDDPSLPAGRRQQIDWAAAGANTSFRYVVTDAQGATIQDREFVSVFRPWQAVYLIGTGS